MYATSKDLGAIKGISEQKVIKLKEIGALAGRWVLARPRRAGTHPALPPPRRSQHPPSRLPTHPLAAAAQKVIPTGFTTAQQIMEQRQELLMISTGCQAFNDILGGGLETGSITELYGEYRCGKTQVRGDGGGGRNGSDDRPLGCRQGGSGGDC